MRLSRPRPASDRDHDRGFTLVEVLISLVLTGLIAGVVVMVILTSLRASSTTTAQVNDSNDTGLISAFLIRDAQSAGGIDPSTAQLGNYGVSTMDWGGCTQPAPAALKVRFSWKEPGAAQPTVVTYALANRTLTRRVCTTGSSAGVDVVLGNQLTFVGARCLSDTSCAGRPRSVSLDLRGSGTPSLFSSTLTATLRTAISQLTISGPPSLPIGQVGQAYPAMTMTTVGDVGTRVWSWSNLPSGLQFNSVTGAISGTPTAAANVTVTVSVTYQWASATRSYALSVILKVNAVPSFTKGLNQVTRPAAVVNTVANWATNISQGAGDSGQFVDFIVSNDNPSLFSVQPAITANGTLTYTPAASMPGKATVSVKIHDDGGTTNGGVDTSAVQTFTIEVKVGYPDMILATTGLGYYWRLGDNTTALTNTFGGVDGIYVNGPTLGVAGAIARDPNTAVQFDGVNDYATTSPTIFDDVSIEFWFKSTQGIGAASWNLGAGMITTDVGPSKDIGVSLTADGRVAAGVATNASAESIFSASGGYNNGSWHQVVFTRVKFGGALQLYVDAVLVASASATSGNLGNGSIPFAFGRIQNPPGNYFKGTLDEISVYKGVLSQAMVTAHYNAGL